MNDIKNEITLYTIGCPACRVLEKKLNAAGIEYTVVDDEKQLLPLGMNVFPMLLADGRLMNFAEAVKWIGEYSK